MFVTDDFSGPTLDATKWSSVEVGSIYLSVGMPTNGVYFHGVDDHGDSGIARSKNKIIIPASAGFNANIEYGGLYEDPGQRVLTFLGWRSNQEDAFGDALHGIDIMLAVDPGPFYIFKKRTINWGVENRSDIKNDPTNGADGKLRIERVGINYSFYFENAGLWELLDTVSFPQIGLGYIIFGLFAEDPALIFPWILQT